MKNEEKVWGENLEKLDPMKCDLKELEAKSNL
jgi:hypothetical protein